ncbi:NADH dehydrogenase FAD-containing subunit [Halovenus sp. WSH3]|uniref:NADH dehydrogenase FAD-containing subunit n=2 Tax=Halovenus carboxidivorans TaxID=2692199 RepID=A0A6B0T8I4_9EURY|nr:NADH dehydrogenase FAD-containing subunit [Halovenus carboxidivorans]
MHDKPSSESTAETLIRFSSGPDRGDATDVLSAAEEVADDVAVRATGPTGITAYEPLALVSTDGETRMYAAVDASQATDLVRAAEAGESTDFEPFAVVEHEDDGTLPVPDEGPLAVGDRRLLAKCGWANPVAPADWTLVSERVTAETRLETPILGRGRGDAVAETPVTEAWDTIRETDGEPVVVVNAHDTDPRHRSDETLLAGATVAVLDAAVTAGVLVGATDVLVLLDADAPVRPRLEEAADALAESLPITPKIAVGPPEYRAGDPTAALEVLEGNDRIEPRRQPPSPASYGLYGRPTAVHSVRTVLQARAALQRELPDLSPPGSDDGEPTDGERAPTRLFSVTGDVDHPAVVELSADDSLSAVREAVAPTDGVGMVCVGGIFGGLTDTLDYDPTAEALTEAGLGLTGGVEILGESRCPVSEAGERVQFAAEENSGRCVPGREGTQQLTELLRDIYGGTFDAEKITELARVMRTTANCQIGATAPRPVTTALDRFGEQFTEHANGTCRHGTCSDNL